LVTEYMHGPFLSSAKLAHNAIPAPANVARFGRRPGQPLPQRSDVRGVLAE
jgi:hypothetical protein